LPGWLLGRAERAGRAWLDDFSTEISVRNVAVSTCKYTKYTWQALAGVGGSGCRAGWSAELEGLAGPVWQALVAGLAGGLFYRNFC
jgi:hypothetical protein